MRMRGSLPLILERRLACSGATSKDGQMIKDSLNALADSARNAFRGWRGLLLLSVLYLLLLACVYEFFSVGVATAWQLVVTGAAAVAAPLLLFVLLAATAHFALPVTETTGALARRCL